MTLSMMNSQAIKALPVSQPVLFAELGEFIDLSLPISLPNATTSPPPDYSTLATAEVPLSAHPTILEAQTQYYLEKKDKKIAQYIAYRRQSVSLIESHLICMMLSDSPNANQVRIYPLFIYKDLQTFLLNLQDWQELPYILAIFSIKDNLSQQFCQAFTRHIDNEAVPLIRQLRAHEQAHTQVFNIAKLWETQDSLLALQSYLIRQQHIPLYALTEHQAKTQLNYSQWYYQQQLTHSLVANAERYFSIAAFSEKWYEPETLNQLNLSPLETSIAQSLAPNILTDKTTSPLGRRDAPTLDELPIKETMRRRLAFVYAQNFLTAQKNNAYQQILPLNKQLLWTKYLPTSLLTESSLAVPILFKNMQEQMVRRVTQSIGKNGIKVSSELFPTQFDRCICHLLGLDSKAALLQRGYTAELMDGIGLLQYHLTHYTHASLWVTNEPLLAQALMCQAIFLASQHAPQKAVQLVIAKAKLAGLKQRFFAFFPNANIEFNLVVEDDNVVCCHVMRVDQVAKTKSSTMTYTLTDSIPTPIPLYHRPNQLVQPSAVVPVAVGYRIVETAHLAVLPTLAPSEYSLYIHEGAIDNLDKLWQLSKATILTPSQIDLIDQLPNYLPLIQHLYDDKLLFVVQKNEPQCIIQQFITQDTAAVCSVLIDGLAAIHVQLEKIYTLLKHIACCLNLTHNQLYQPLVELADIDSLFEQIDFNTNLKTLIQHATDFIANGQTPTIVIDDSQQSLQSYAKLLALRHFGFESSLPSEQLLKNFIAAHIEIEFPTLKQLIELMLDCCLYFIAPQKNAYLNLSQSSVIQSPGIHASYTMLMQHCETVRSLASQPIFAMQPLSSIDAFCFQMRRMGYSFGEVSNRTLRLTPTTLSGKSPWLLSTHVASLPTSNEIPFDGWVVADTRLPELLVHQADLFNNGSQQFLLPQTLTKLESYQCFSQNPLTTTPTLSIYHYFTANPINELISPYLIAKLSQQNSATIKLSTVLAGETFNIPVATFESPEFIAHISRLIQLYHYYPLVEKHHDDPISLLQALGRLENNKQRLLLTGLMQFLSHQGQTLPIALISQQKNPLHSKIFDLNAVITQSSVIQTSTSHQQVEIFFKIDYAPIELDSIYDKAVYYLQQNIEQLQRLVKQHPNYAYWCDWYADVNQFPEAHYFSELSEFEQLLYIYKHQLLDMPLKGLRQRLIYGFDQLPLTKLDNTKIQRFITLFNELMVSDSAVTELVILLGELNLAPYIDHQLYQQINSYILLLQHLNLVERFYADNTIAIPIVTTVFSANDYFINQVLDGQVSASQLAQEQVLGTCLLGEKAQLMRKNLSTEVLFTVGYQLPDIDGNHADSSSFMTYIAQVGQDKHEQDKSFDVRHICHHLSHPHYQIQQGLIEFTALSLQASQKKPPKITLKSLNPIEYLENYPSVWSVATGIFQGDEITNTVIETALAQYQVYKGIVRQQVVLGDISTLNNWHQYQPFNFTDKEGKTLYGWVASPPIFSQQ